MGTHGPGIDTLTKDIPISSADIFGGDLSKVVAKAASASGNDNTLVNNFVLSGLPRPKPLRGGKQKASSLPPFLGRGQSQNWQCHSCFANRGRKRKRTPRDKGAGHQTGKPKQRQWQQPKSGGKSQAKPLT